MLLAIKADIVMPNVIFEVGYIQLEMLTETMVAALANPATHSGATVSK